MSTFFGYMRNFYRHGCIGEERINLQLKVYRLRSISSNLDGFSISCSQNSTTLPNLLFQICLWALHSPLVSIVCLHWFIVPFLVEEWPNRNFKIPRQAYGVQEEMYYPHCGLAILFWGWMFLIHCLLSQSHQKCDWDAMESFFRLDFIHPAWKECLHNIPFHFSLSFIQQE